MLKLNKTDKKKHSETLKKIGSANSKLRVLEKVPNSLFSKSIAEGVTNHSTLPVMTIHI